jgi:hypothetical protein
VARGQRDESLRLQHWDRGFESHLRIDVCVCSVCANFGLNLLVKLNEK